MMATLHSIRQWGEFILVMTALVFLFLLWQKPAIFKPIVNPTPVTVTAPDNKDTIKKIEELNKKLDALTKKIDQLQKLGQANVDNALKERDVKKSVQDMKDNWNKKEEPIVKKDNATVKRSVQDMMRNWNKRMEP